MKIIELSNREVKCQNCKSILLIEPIDIEYDIVYSQAVPYYYCMACGSKNQNVPEEYKKGPKDKYKRLFNRY